MRPERQKLIIAKALAYAIKTIENLPPRWREQSDMEDMKIILEGLGVYGQIALKSASYHLDGAGWKDWPDEEAREG